jgi:hypothetical protein
VVHRDRCRPSASLTAGQPGRPPHAGQPPPLDLVEVLHAAAVGGGGVSARRRSRPQRRCFRSRADSKVERRVGIAGGVGRAGAQGVPSGCGRRPVVRPVLPLVGALRRFKLRWVQSPSPVRLTCTSVTGPVPDQASSWTGWFGRVRSRIRRRVLKARHPTVVDGADAFDVVGMNSGSPEVR